MCHHYLHVKASCGTWSGQYWPIFGENFLKSVDSPIIYGSEHELGLTYLGVSLGFKSNSLGTSKADS